MPASADVHPLIAVTTSELRTNRGKIAIPESEPPQVGGVCLSGGPDLDPEAYGESPHAQIGPTWSELDEFELAVARAADARGMPILAICRGAQVLNVARGGRLHQHLPDVVGEQINHRQGQPGERSTHWITFAENSRISQIVRRCRTKVNSFHHQAPTQSRRATGSQRRRRSRRSCRAA